MDFDKTPWLDGFKQAGLSFDKIDYVFCTHLHIDHCGWNTVLRDGRWVPTFPNAKYVFHKREYAYWEAATARGENPPGQVWNMNCLPIVEAGQALLVDDDYALDDTITLTPTPGPFAVPLLRQHLLQGPARGGHRRHDAPRAAMPGARVVHCVRHRRQAGCRSRGGISWVRLADTDTLILPVHFPAPTVGLIKADGSAFDYRFKRDD